MQIKTRFGYNLGGQKRPALEPLLPEHEAVERVQQMVDGQASRFAVDAQGPLGDGLGPGGNPWNGGSDRGELSDRASQMIPLSRGPLISEPSSRNYGTLNVCALLRGATAARRHV